ncbi:MAG TPA: Na+-transporting oxaloacetate decarboxylase subunit gamma [Campylobacterales bacterium]|jgi:oxaloacetate decarboxylase gamma subunit|nr:Na+-transporting oxaloacetate decarboxylase subunit gamma [Campylobacterales bacterium]
MAEVNYIAEAFKFMVLGMGVVFLFLIVLVQLIKLQAKLINKYFPETTPKSSVTPVSSTSDDEQRTVAAIIAAVAEFRKNKS